MNIAKSVLVERNTSAKKLFDMKRKASKEGVSRSSLWSFSAIRLTGTMELEFDSGN